jgi:hypothetical protein
MGRLEVEAGAAHSLAHASREINRSRLDKAHPEARARAEANFAEADAEMWAAQKILDALKALPAPEIPVDHTKNQTTIEEAIAATPDA